MKTDKDEILTYRFRVDDPAKAEEFLAALLVAHGLGQTFGGVHVTACARGDVFADLDNVEELLCAASEFLDSSNEEQAALLDKIDALAGFVPEEDE